MIRARDCKPGDKIMIRYPMDDGYFREYRYEVAEMRSDCVALYMTDASHCHPEDGCKFHYTGLRRLVTTDLLYPVEVLS